jgi:hypothetical protein
LWHTWSARAKYERWFYPCEDWPAVLALAAVFQLDPAGDLAKAQPKEKTKSKDQKSKIEEEDPEPEMPDVDGGDCPVEAGTGQCTSDGNCGMCPRNPRAEPEDPRRKKRPAGEF